MGTMKKKKARPPKRTLKRPERLLNAKEWLPAVDYTGKRLVHAYRKKYHTDLLCSIAELRLLGAVITVEYEEAVKQAIADWLAQKQQKEAEKQEMLIALHDGQDEDFAFIAGYTSGGAPYGLTWEDWDEQDDLPEPE